MAAADDVLLTAAELKTKGVPFVLATVVRCESPTSAKPGAKAIVAADGTITGWIGGGCAQPAVVSMARKALSDGQPRLIRISPTRGGDVEEGVVDFGMTCHSGGTLDIFLEPFGRRASLLVVGTSPAAQSLVSLASQVGFDVYAAAPGAAASMFPAARQVVDGLDLAGLACGAPEFVVVATQGKRDEQGLEAALGTGAGYIAFIASGRKAEKLRAYLKERGHDPADVDRIASPAGVDIGAVSPEEIALSVLGGVVKARRAGAATAARGSTGRTGHGTAAESGAAAMPAETGAPGSGSAIDPICGMSVEIASATFRTEFRGRWFYFCCAGCQHRFEKDPEAYVQHGS
jgi:xanthine dehydrogenase accessory factor